MNIAELTRGGGLVNVYKYNYLLETGEGGGVREEI